MKKYRVTFKRSGKVWGEYASKEEASEKLMRNIRNYNAYLGSEGDYLSRFDFLIEEVESTGIWDIVTDYEQAKKVLGGKKNAGNVSQKIERPFEGINKKHIEALMALNELFTIADAWNKADGFIPDFSDWNQNKWCPWFKYDKDAAGFVFSRTLNAPVYADANFGSRLCFKSSTRAAQFGKKFTHLYNKVFL